MLTEKLINSWFSWTVSKNYRQNSINTSIIKTKTNVKQRIRRNNLGFN